MHARTSKHKSMSTHIDKLFWHGQYLEIPTRCCYAPHTEIPTHCCYAPHTETVP